MGLSIRLSVGEVPASPILTVAAMREKTCKCKNAYA